MFSVVVACCIVKKSVIGCHPYEGHQNMKVPWRYFGLEPHEVFLPKKRNCESGHREWLSSASCTRIIFISTR